MRSAEASRGKFLDMSPYQWLVLFAAWLGWGFDVFDGLLFNYVAKNCVPTLLGVPIGSPEAAALVPVWTGRLTSLLLVGWGIGGLLFGKICDRFGRTRTLMLTMLMYAVGTALCAVAPNIWVLIACRIVASLGIGGEWAAGASMVAEVVPEKRRVEAGALLYTAAPMGLFLATYVTYWIQGVAFPAQPEVAWRYVFLCGLIPAAAAFVVRAFVKEPDRWKDAGDKVQPAIAELFRSRFLRTTLSGLGMAVIALLMWWSCNAFIPIMSESLAKSVGAKPEEFKKIATNSFNLGGLIGTLLTVPIAKRFGRRWMFLVYFLSSALAIYGVFGLEHDALRRCYLCFFIGLTVFGVFGSFTYFLPELYPTRLRATGAGFCYNAGRFVAAFGPTVVGTVAKQGTAAILSALAWVAVVPIVGLFFLPFILETYNRPLQD